MQDISNLDGEAFNLEDELSQLQNRIVQLNKMKQQRQAVAPQIEEVLNQDRQSEQNID